jgi:hypothetical protein
MPIAEEKKKLLDQGLPVVSSKTLDALFHVYAGKKWGQHLEQVRDRLIQENPNLIKFIESQIGKFPRELHDAIFEIVIGTVAVLELQEMVDRKNVKVGNVPDEQCECLCHKKPEGWRLATCPLNCQHCKHCKPEAFLRKPAR